MADDRRESPAEHFYSEGNQYDWKQDQSPAAASLARANFQQAAAMGHKGAVRALAHMIYEGRGGPKDKAQALLLLWSGFTQGDGEALEELGDLLASYAEELDRPSESTAAAATSETVEGLVLALSKVSNYMHRLARARAQELGT